MNDIDRLNTLQKKIEGHLGMSILTPHEILLHLGFKIPEKGVTINPYDRLLHIESLKLLGKTMNVKRIPKEELMSLRDKMALEYRYLSKSLKTRTDRKTDIPMDLSKPTLIQGSNDR